MHYICRVTAHFICLHMGDTADVTASSNALLGVTFIHWNFSNTCDINDTVDAGDERTDHYSVFTELRITRLPAAKAIKEEGPVRRN